MKAALFYGPKDIRVQEIEKPKITSKEVLIKVKAAGICGSDIHFYKGEAPIKLDVGTVLGHELSGEVVAIGDEVKSIKIGDRVGVEPLIGCGKCVFCKIGQYHLCKNLKHIGYAYKGGFAEYTKVPQENIYNLPDNVTYEEASLLDSYAVSVHALNRVTVKINDIVVIIGGGTLGITTAQLVKLAGAKKVIVIDLLDEVLQVARKAGIDYILNASKIDVVNEVMKLTDDMGADIVFESVGGEAPTLNQSVQMIKPGGTIGIIGIRNKGSMDFWSAHTKEINIIFIWSYAKWGINAEFKIALNLLESKKINATPLISYKYTLDKINDAFATALNKKESNAVKVIINP
jgi:L-iditol 2-dehydrogenase